MTTRIEQRQLTRLARLVDAPGEQRACTDRCFNLPTALHAGFFGLFLAYLAVMAVGFPHPEMVIPMAIFIFFTAAFYVVPMLWATMGPANASKAMSLRDLLDHGVRTETGLTGGGAAVTQVLILPVLILLWGIAMVVIAAYA